MKTTDKRKISAIVFGLAGTAVVLTFVILVYVKENEPIRIGLSTTLTGTSSTAGAHTRNGAMLAVEQINRSGGINGRPVELIIRDDRADPEEALRVDRKLIDRGVVAILGHYLSTLSVRTVPLMNERNVLMQAIGSTTAELSGLDDNSIRVASPVDKRARPMAVLIYDRLGLRKMAVVIDGSNREYTASWHRHFKYEFEKMGGEISSAITFEALGFNNSKALFSKS